jgi:hypothetical protein
VPELQPVPTVYTVCALPGDDFERRHFEIHLERRPGNRWVVSRRGWREFADVDGIWSQGSDPGVQWRARHWTPWETAVAVAVRLAPKVEHNGVTAAEHLTRRSERIREAGR